MGNKDTGLQPVTIAYFKAPTKQGKELYEIFQKKINNRLLRGHSVKLFDQTEYKMMPAITACLDFYVVIFDASIESEQSDMLQYRAAIELMKFLDHVLIVSRTTLPVNFAGMRKGGAPEMIKSGTSEYKTSMTNCEILEWIMDTLENSSIELPRKLKMDMRPDEYEKNKQFVINIEAQMISNSVKKIHEEKGVFVSYLSRYSKYYHGHHPEEPYVEELFEDISRISGVPDSAITYFPPGKISLELMTAQRRFEIVSATEIFIKKCKAFWIYKTSDYDSSWWAFGEKMSLVHLYGRHMDKCPDIYIAKPVRGENGKWTFQIKKYLTVNEKTEFLPRLTPFEQRELDRLYINSNPMTTAYEQVEKMRRLASMPDLLLKLESKLQAAFIRQQFQVLIEGLDADERDKKEALEEMQRTDRMIESVRSYVYSKEFWEIHLIDCPVCRAVSKSMMNSSKYMYFEDQYIYEIEEKDYQEIMKTVRNGKIYTKKLPCGHSVSLKQSGQYYRWWTVKNDIPSGPNEKLIEDVCFISFC